jgi:drug/metabolite transporter (DMT)-like permease
VLAFCGAMVMLWKPNLGVPWPTARAEWLGLLAGMLFALGNVLVRKLDTMTDAGKSIVIWAGVSVSALVFIPASRLSLGAAWDIAAEHALLIGGVSVALFAMSLAMQYGLARMAANRAIVILLFELVVAAIASWLLTDETMRFQDWVGGALIVAASLVSGWIERSRAG